MVSRCKNSKVILSAVTSGYGESTIITNSVGSTGHRAALVAAGTVVDQEYLAENGHRPSDTSNHRLRYGYLVYIYTAGFDSSDSKRCDIRTALKEDLRYAVRWMIFIDALGLGVVLVCGEAIARLVCVRSAVPSLFTDLV